MLIQYTANEISHIGGEQFKWKSESLQNSSLNTKRRRFQAATTSCVTGLYDARTILNQKEIHIISGVRRCGKSTLMRLLMGKLIEEGTKNQNILYLNFEDRFEDFSLTIRPD